jgi:ABC-type multidrug transport system fused ATPase/permease subunit
VQTEKQIQTAIRGLAGKRTVIAIAHRLSTIREADLILVVRHGEIVEQGTHEQLLARKGLYYELHRTQEEAAQG